MESRPSFVSFHSPTPPNATSYLHDPTQKVRKPYTITKSRESWTDPEHEKFLEAIQLFDRDWKKIESFIGSKTIIQIRSHAQKYFTKAQKSGTNERLPPPRPKRKAAHPYPQKASKVGRVASQEIMSFQAFPARRDTSSLLRHTETIASFMPGWNNNVQTISFPHATTGDVRSAAQPLPNINSYLRSESTPRPRSTVLPDFARVYSFLGSVFDPNVTGHVQKLKKMDPIDIDTVLLLMRNLTVNLASPDFEDHRRLLSSYEIEPEKG